jgi:hypothetical protein
MAVVADIGQHCLGPTAVAEFPPLRPRRIVLAIAQVIADLPV